MYSVDDKLIFPLLSVLLIGFPTQALDPNKVLFLVLSQPDKYSSNLAEQLRTSILDQAASLNKPGLPKVLLSHEDFPSPASWTVLPVLPELVSNYNITTNAKHNPDITTNTTDDNVHWVFICEDRTEVKLHGLLTTLQEYDHTKELWLGHSLYDREASIIHHFAFFDDPTHFKYPHMGAGIALTIPLVQSVSRRFASQRALAEFSIDGAHELALFVRAAGRGPGLAHEGRLCAHHDENDRCATYPRPFKSCGPAVAQESLYFAVKTCEKFHHVRLPVVQSTWGRRAGLVKYFSEVEDPLIPTVGLNIENTDAGHCAKTLAILSTILHEIRQDEAGSSIKWVVLADDDTILSVSRIRELLSCYDYTTPAVIGERYGYNLQSTQGYNYITGGGGMVLTVPLLESIVMKCKCPSPRSPDDMLLGLCLARLGLVITHSPYFHQARPVDYAPEYLKSSRQVSFHKHWMIDPIQVYEEWFSAADLSMSEEHNHVEL